MDRILRNRVVAEKSGRNPQESGLANQLVAVKAVVIGHAVDHIVVGARPLSVDADVHKAAARGALHARCEAENGFEVAAFGGQIQDGLGVDLGVHARGVVH